jgi:hypothetical protein
MADREASVRVFQLVVFSYLMAILAIVGALLVWPFSKALNLALFALLGVFFATAFLVIAHALIFVISRGEGLGVLRYARARIISAQINRLSRASDPVDVRLSRVKLRRLCPELFESRGNLIAWLDRLIGSRAALIFQIADHLSHGDSRAAVVVSVAPLLVAAYTDEMDCIAMLQFPDELARECDLHVRDRLLTVNRYASGGRLAPDLEHGRLSYERFSNFQPIIADFLADDFDQLRQRKIRIGEDEWVRTWVLGQRYLERFGNLARNGRPPFGMRPAAVEAGGKP